MGMPSLAQPSKKTLLVAISGLASFVLCLVILFVLFYLDDTIKTPKQLADLTNIAVLGAVPTITVSLQQFNEQWNNDANKSMTQFKKFLRAIRYEITHEMGAAKILGLTSVNYLEGKTLVSISLAQAYAMTNKKVLVIDGNFETPVITSTVSPEFYLEDYLAGTIGISDFETENSIDFLGNKGGDVSLFELSNEQTIDQKLNTLKFNYDIILIEITPLSTLNKAKEWINVSEKIIAVFETYQTLNQEKLQHVEYLKKLDNKFIGWVLNKAGKMKMDKKKSKRLSRKKS
jgi:Mrp family chromosome partitioning ATPase